MSTGQCAVAVLYSGKGNHRSVIATGHASRTVWYTDLCPEWPKDGTFALNHCQLDLVTLLNVACDIIFRYDSNEVEHSQPEFCS